MNKWSITKLSKNKYTITKDNQFIEVMLVTELLNNPEVLLTNTRDMSEDYVIFYPNTYPTNVDESAIIGEAFAYDGLKCINKSLVTAVITNTNISNAKDILELLCE